MEDQKYAKKLVIDISQVRQHIQFNVDKNKAVKDRLTMACTVYVIFANSQFSKLFHGAFVY